MGRASRVQSADALGGNSRAHSGVTPSKVQVRGGKQCIPEVCGQVCALRDLMMKSVKGGPSEGQSFWKKGRHSGNTVFQLKCVSGSIHVPYVGLELEVRRAF